MSERLCRACGQTLRRTFLNLGMSPLSNSFINEAQLSAKESFYPLHTFVCEQCFLVQLEEFEAPEAIFGEYAYFSSFADTWLRHAKTYVDMMIDRFQLSADSSIVEIASNDGYLLQYFRQQGFKVQGIEPAANVAKVATEKGIPTIVDYFGADLAKTLRENGQGADVLIGNNVLAHVPDLNGFVAGLKIALNPQGIITMEFPHLLRLIQDKQFDTIYHEHFSYFSLITVSRIFENHGLIVTDVEELPTHGGSLRIFANHAEDRIPVSPRVAALLADEKSYGLQNIIAYEQFSAEIERLKRDILKLLVKLKNENRQIVAYGAPAKGNTLLNYCGIRTDFIDYTVDRSPHKQGLYLPGTHIPVYNPEVIRRTRPDYVVILPWNLKEEILEQLSFIRDWGGKFIILVPSVQVI